MTRSLCKNGFLPKQSLHRRDHIRESGIVLGIPFCTSYSDTMSTRVLGKNQADHTEQSQQTRSSTQYRPGDMLSWRLKTQMSTNLLKRRLDGPTRRKPTDNLNRFKAYVSCVIVFVPMGSLHIVNEDPANWYQASTRFIPAAPITDQFYMSVTASIPTDHSRDRLSACDNLRRRRQLTAFDARPAHSFVNLWRRGVEIGVTVASADEGGVSPMPIIRRRRTSSCEA